MELPKHVQITFDAKLALVKTLRIDVDVSYKDYKNFRSSSRIVPIGEQSDNESHPTFRR